MMYIGETLLSVGSWLNVFYVPFVAMVLYTYYTGYRLHIATTIDDARIWVDRLMLWIVIDVAYIVIAYTVTRVVWWWHEVMKDDPNEGDE